MYTLNNKINLFFTTIQRAKICCKWYSVNFQQVYAMYFIKILLIFLLFTKNSLWSLFINKSKLFLFLPTKPETIRTNITGRCRSLFNKFPEIPRWDLLKNKHKEIHLNLSDKMFSAAEPKSNIYFQLGFRERL